MAWSNLYAADEGGIHITIFENCKSKLVATDFPNKEPCFRKFMRVARLRIVIFQKTGLWGIRFKNFGAEKRMGYGMDVSKNASNVRGGRIFVISADWILWGTNKV